MGWRCDGSFTVRYGWEWEGLEFGWEGMGASKLGFATGDLNEWFLTLIIFCAGAIRIICSIYDSLVFER